MQQQNMGKVEVFLTHDDTCSKLGANKYFNLATAVWHVSFFIMYG